MNRQGKGEWELMRSWLARTRGLLLKALLALVVVISVILPVAHVALADGEKGATDLSLYQRASELTREFATALAPGSQVNKMYMLESTESENLLVAGNAGALLGYAEILSDDTGIVGWLMNSYTTASATITYDQLMHVVDNKGDDTVSAVLNNPFFQYAGYGETLTEMGLVSTLRPGLGSTLRLVGTGLVLLVYLLANAAPFLFRGALMILVTLNPFKLFETAMNGTASAKLGIISGIAEYVGTMYEAVQNFSVVFLLPLLLALTLFGVLMLNKGSAMKRFGRYGVRVFMLFAGLPLIGATYTGVVEDLETKVSVGSEYADYLVLSSYVDFEGWVKYSRLAPPKDAYISSPRYGKDEKRSISNREMILDINGTRAANERAVALEKRYKSTSDIDKIFKKGGSKQDVDEGVYENSGSFSEVYSILTRHMMSAKYASSDYDGEVSGQIQKIRGNSKKDDEQIVKMFTLSASDSRTWNSKLNPFSGDPDWMKPVHWNGTDNKVDDSAKGLFTAGNALNDTFKFGKYSYNIYNTGDLRYEAGVGYVSPNMPKVVSEKTAPIGTSRGQTVGGLSPIAMYNFLNTTFSDTGLTVYSPNKTSSDLSRDAYAAVTFGGSGVSAFTRWLENVAVMLSLAILSIAYGIMMISLAIKNIPRILTSVFGTAFGSIAFTTKLLISTAVMIIQIIGAIFLYTLSENIIMTLLLNFNSLVDNGGEYFGAGVIFDFLSSFLVTAITVTVTWFMVRNMKVFKEMLEEVVSNAINRLMSGLDVSTGGKGLDIGRSTGGRIGGDGRLTDAAKAPNVPSGIAGLLQQAHDIESRREDAAEKLNPDGQSPSVGNKLKRRAKTMAGLMNAEKADKIADSMLGGLFGGNRDRAVDAAMGSIRDMVHNKNGSNDLDNKFGDADDSNINASNAGQSLDENGDVKLDENGNALDVNGNIISPNSPLGMAGAKPMVGEDGSLLDSDGNTFTDEMGNAFYQNEKGQLVDENGNLMTLGNDGVLRPLEDGESPVSAMNEAKKLDNMRFDADNYAAMKDEQDATHFGLDKNGNAIGLDGKPLQMKGKDGLSPVQLDENGFVIDKDGNKVSAASIAGGVDPKGFEKITDPATGETHLRHRGDSAIKSGANADAGSKNLTSLAKQSNKANAVAKRAAERVDQLKAQGASPYAVQQAERFAEQATRNAQQAQSAFNSAMQSGGQSIRQPVTNDHVTSAVRHAKTEQASLKESMGRLEQMRDGGASPEAIQRQERRVNEQKQTAQNAQRMADDMQLAHKVGRSYGEVSTARTKVDKAEQLFNRAQEAHSQAILNGAPRSEVAKYEQKVNKASQMLSDSRRNMSRVSEPPSGTPAQIDAAEARYTTAQMAHNQAVASRQNLEALRNEPVPQELKAERKEAMTQAKRNVHQAKTKLTRAEHKLNELQQNGADPKTIRAAEKAKNQATSAYKSSVQSAKSLASAPIGNQPSKAQIEAARKAEQQAKRQMTQAFEQRQSLLDPVGWGSKASSASKNVNSVPSVPSMSPSKSYATLAASGISNYSDYQNKLKEESEGLRKNQSKLRQAKQRLSSLKANKRPTQIVEQAENQVRELSQSIKKSQSNVASLKENAQGLLKNGQFKPSIASRPIRTNGASIVNKLMNVENTQALYDNLVKEKNAGSITSEGRAQLESVSNRLSQMKRELIQSGIKEDAIKDRATIVQSAKHMTQSWESFVEGKSIEHTDK